ncbi:hypothetical protein QF043_003085 [Pseudomonas sp. W3I7]|jgi:hypothetical protein|uniref:hypothetical protein n=1 Tax=Pseudomonas sp. W3I7 TaxID=3042292 RepID=UPI00278FCC3E|nr:hypothetical protein [Pseudomonas sp. W3I7]MDQ0704293.1 hypothetical protein [Pseudomonas sp. W3I7]
MNEGVKPHYKLARVNSNFVLKFLFNALSKKNAPERVSQQPRDEMPQVERIKMRLMPSPAAALLDQNL